MCLLGRRAFGVKGFLEGLSDFKADGLFAGHLDARSGLGVSGSPRPSVFEPEVPEAPNLDLLPLFKRALYALKDRVDYNLRLLEGEPLHSFRDLFYKSRPCHSDLLY